MQSTLTIDGTTYSNVDRSANRIRIDGFDRTLEGGYDTLHFSVMGGLAAYRWPNGTAVSADFDLGSGFQTRFSGIVTHAEHGQTRTGWRLGYTAQGLKFLADRVVVTAPDGTGAYVLNRTPDDEDYLASDAGLTVGAIFTRVLTIPATAQALDAVGVGNFTGLPSAPVLPAATVADFALLTVVPPRPVDLSGAALFGTLDSILAQWMPKWVLEIQPDGTIRAKDTTDVATFVPRTLTLGSSTGPGDLGVEWPTVRRSTDRCATRVLLRGGPDIAAVLLSTADGTLAKGWSGGQESAWTLFDFTQPKDAKDAGTISAVTSSSVTVHSSDAVKTWAANFWSGRQAIIYLYDDAASGISLSEYRYVTSNGALSAGGSCTVSWDSSNPITASGYTRYRLIGFAGGNIDVGRLYYVREPATGATGTATYIGAHLVKRSPRPIQWGNATRSLPLLTSSAIVGGGSPLTEFPIGVEPVPSLGAFRLTQPDVTIYGNPATLNTGYPTTIANGMPDHVEVLALYSRGPLNAVQPADIAGVPQYDGTAFTEDGIEHTEPFDYPQWTFGGDFPSMIDLAREKLDSLHDAVIEGSVRIHGTDALAWDFLLFESSLNFDIDGITSPWSAINAPVRSVSVTWGQGTGAFHEVTVGFSTRRRAFSGDDLYTHPAFRMGSALTQALGADAGSVALPTDALTMMLNGGQSLMTGGGSQGNAGAFADALLAGQVSGGGASLPGDMAAMGPGMEDSGFGMADALMAGMDLGGGVRDAGSQAAQEQREHTRQMEAVARRQAAERRKLAARRDLDPNIRFGPGVTFEGQREMFPHDPIPGFDAEEGGE